MPTVEVQIGGEPRQLAEFMAFKAILALEITSGIERAWRDVLTEVARFKREFEAENYVEMDRAEARRQFRARPLVRERREEQEDGRIALITEPVIEDGRPVMGPDPLGHLTDQDWAANDHRLRVPDSPSRNLQIAAMVPVAFRVGREHLTRLIGLVLTPNADLEAWDGTEDIDAKLDEAGKAIMHRAKADELVRLVGASLALCQEQLRGPFDEIATQVQTMWSGSKEEAVVEPMRVETAESPTSSTSSEDDSDGTTEPSSTEPVGASSSNSESG